MMRGERVLGALWGAAIGDALGAAFEFVPSSAIESHLGEAFAREYRTAIPGSLLSGHAAGVPTDDTAMALSVAMTIVETGEPTAADFAERFLADLRPGAGMTADLFWDGGPGGATTKALRSLRCGADPATCGTADAGGNGAAMRAHPVGFLRSREAVLALAAVQARVTHGHPAAVAAAQAVAVLVHDAIEDRSASAACPEGIADAAFRETWQAFHAHVIPVEGRLPAKLRDVEMSGWETVAAAHAITLCFPNDPADAIYAAAASGRDTDTVATIAGAIVGARLGIAGLRASLRERLLASPAIDTVTAALSSAIRCGTLG